MFRLLLIFLVLVAASGSAGGQQGNSSLGWDFSYKSLLERNNVGKDVLIRHWLAGIKSPAERWISDWQGKPITSSILIEYPAFHAAERQTLWLVRTSDEAHYWELTEPLGTKQWAKEAENEEPVSPAIYDAIYKEASTWEQLSPKRAEDLPDQVFPGYMGFISLYGPNGSRQMLLTFEDFFVCPTKVCAPGKGKAGRLFAALEPLLTPESEKNYKHKSEAEIARMTPEQRIDEEMLEHDNHFLDHADKQSELIIRYRRLDGLKGLPYLIQLMDGYQPKRVRDTRFFQALMIADEIDDRVVRLRASPEGREAIKAIERLAVRIKAAGKSDSQVEMTLRFVKGANFADEAIRDTLWVLHRIKMSDDELLQFSNYLVKRDPTYPSWSDSDFIKDDSRKNEAGNPFQVYIMKDPKRFYLAYLDFKKAHSMK